MLSSFLNAATLYNKKILAICREQKLDLKNRKIIYSLPPIKGRGLY